MALVVVVLLGAAALIMAARRAQPVHEVSDGAIIELSVLQAIEGRQLLGPYSRFGWHHPGPLFFYWTAPWYRLSGDRTAGAQAGALALNVLCMLLTIGLVARHARWPTTAVVATALLVLAVRVHDGLASVWNPHVVLLPFLGLMVSAAVAAAGGGPWRVWLLCAVLASFTAQTHIALAPVSAVILAGACLAAMARGGDGGRAWGGFARMTGALVVLWSPPIVEQLTGTPGNMTSIWRYFFTGHHDGQGWAAALSVWSSMLVSPLGGSFRLPWGAPLPPASSLGAVLLAFAELVGLVFVVWKSRRTGHAMECALAGVCLLMSAVAFWAVTRIDPPVMDHDVFWIGGLGALQAAVVVGGICSVLSRSDRGVAFEKAVVTAIGGMSLIGCLTLGIREMRVVVLRPADAPDDRAIVAVTEGVRRAVGSDSSGPVLVEIDQSVWPIAAGVLLQLRKADVPYVVEERWASIFGDGVPPRGEAPITIAISGPDLHGILVARPGNQVIAGDGPVFADAVRRR